MKRLQSQGDNPSRIAAALNMEGTFNRLGKNWHPHSVSRILEAQK